MGTADSEAYQEMQQAIPQGSRLSERARRNEIQRLERKLQSLDKEVSVAQTNKRRTKQAALTTLVRELLEKVQGLVAEGDWLKRQLSLHCTLQSRV